MAAFARRSNNDGSNELGAEVGVDERGSHRESRAGRSVMAAFARRSNNKKSRGSKVDKSVTVSSGSVFVPLGSEGLGWD